MSNDPPSIGEPADNIANRDETTSRPGKTPWVSLSAIAICVAVFLGLAINGDHQSWDTLAKFGLLPASSIWEGGYWALGTSALVHIALWHLAFNVYWLWRLGGPMERAIGSWPYLAFFVISAFISSSFQLAVSDATGHGASGVVYAIFGFMWLARRRYSQFNDVLDGGTIRLFLIWLIGCVAATYPDVWEVGNAAHISGLLFGAAVAGCFVLHYLRPLMVAGLAGLVLLSIIPLFWCPWSIAWLSHQAYDAHAAHRYHDALAQYTRILNRDPRNAWALLNRSFVYREIGQPEKADTDLQAARKIDPAIEER
jgi:GlpG protein